MSFIKKLGEQVGGGIIGTGMGMLDEAISGSSRRRKQVEQQKKLTDINVAAQKDLMSLAQEQQLQMWKDTSFSAQMRELANAGLNPALIYGGGGEGVTGTIGGGGVGTGQASTEAEQKTAQTQAQALGLQMAKTSAEIDVLKSQAEKNKADADYTGGAKTEETKAIATLNELNADILATERDVRFDLIRTQARKANEELRILINDADISDEVKIDKILQYKAEVKETIVNILNKVAETELTKRQIDEIDEKIEIAWYNAASGRLQAEKISIGQVLGKIAEKSGLSKEVEGAINDLIPDFTVENVVNIGKEAGGKTRKWIYDNLSDRAIIDRIKGNK